MAMKSIVERRKHESFQESRTCTEINMNMKYSKHHLLNNHDLVLHAWEGDGERFVAMFRGTWDQIPSDVRATILDFCLARHAVIELSDTFGPNDAFGQVDSIVNGREVVEITVRFRAPAFAHFPRAAAQWVIAHELAHVYEKACGRLPGPDERGDTENRVNQMVGVWGFRRDCLAFIIMIHENRNLSIADACAEVDRLRLFADTAASSTGLSKADEM